MFSGPKVASEVSVATQGKFSRIPVVARLLVVELLKQFAKDLPTVKACLLTSQVTPAAGDPVFREESQQTDE